MGGGGGDSGALDLERKELAAQQQLLNEKRQKLETKRIASLRAKFTSGGLQSPGTSATAPAAIGTQPVTGLGAGKKPLFGGANRELGG